MLTRLAIDTWYSADYMRRFVNSSALQSYKWQLIGMSYLTCTKTLGGRGFAHRPYSESLRIYSDLPHLLGSQLMSTWRLPQYHPSLRSPSDFELALPRNVDFIPTTMFAYCWLSLQTSRRRMTSRTSRTTTSTTTTTTMTQSRCILTLRSELLKTDSGQLVLHCCRWTCWTDCWIWLLLDFIVVRRIRPMNSLLTA